MLVANLGRMEGMDVINGQRLSDILRQVMGARRLRYPLTGSERLNISFSYWAQHGRDVFEMAPARTTACFPKVKLLNYL